MAGEGKASIREKIIETSINLFNEHGVKNVPIHRISAALDMSPGHFNYYFKKKHDLIYDLIQQLETELSALQKALLDNLEAGQGSIDPQEGARVVLSELRLMWKYRFFFSAITSLIQSDPELETRYLRFEAAFHEKHALLFQSSIDAGFMRPVRHPHTVAALVENLWYIWLSGLSSQLIKGRDETDAIYICAQHHLLMIDPYITRQFSSGLYTAIREQLGLT